MGQKKWLQNILKYLAAINLYKQSILNLQLGERGFYKRIKFNSKAVPIIKSAQNALNEHVELGNALQIGEFGEIIGEFCTNVPGCRVATVNVYSDF